MKKMQNLKHVILASLLVGLGIISSCSEDEEPPVIITPEFSFVIDGESGRVTFTNESIIENADEMAATYLWNFGVANATSVDENPVYNYTESGTFSVSLTVTVTIPGSQTVETHTEDVEVFVASTPELTLTGDLSITVPLGTEFVDPGATAIDANDGDLTASIVVEGSVNVYGPDAYTLTYTITNSSGTSVSVERAVTVEGAAGNLYYDVVNGSRPAGYFEYGDKTEENAWPNFSDGLDNPNGYFVNGVKPTVVEIDDEFGKNNVMELNILPGSTGTPADAPSEWWRAVGSYWFTFGDNKVEDGVKYNVSFDAWTDAESGIRIDMPFSWAGDWKLRADSDPGTAITTTKTRYTLQVTAPTLNDAQRATGNGPWRTLHIITQNASSSNAKVWLDNIEFVKAE